MKTGAVTFVVALLAALFASSVSASRREPELTPSCIDFRKVKKFTATGEKGIAKKLAQFDEAREETTVESRNINWDGAAVTNLISEDTNSVELPGDLFLNGAGFRQIVFTDSTLALTASDDGFAQTFNGTKLGEEPFGADAFSGNVNVAPLNANQVVVSFTLEDRKTAGLVNGFAAIFTDVESKNSAGLVFYDAAGAELLTVYAKRKKSGTQQLVGAIFDETVVAQVEILFGDNGNLDLDDHEGKNNDFVAVDDWFFFLSDTEVPTVTYRGAVEERDDEIIEQFENRRMGLDFDKIQNINWDGGAVTSLTNGESSTLPRDIFKVGAGFRQLTIALDAEQPVASEDAFASFLSGDEGLNSFTGTVNFAPANAKTLTLDFFLEGANTNSVGLIHGIGIIFTDVELPNKSGLRAFDEHGNLIANVRARPQESGTHQFIGVMFSRAVIAKVILDMGDNDVGDVGEGQDLVAVDDWLFFRSAQGV